MRHRKTGRKFNRTSSHREAMFRNMVTSLFKHDRIRTTDAKAKELRSWSDHMITLAKRGDLHARRQALAIIREKEIVHKLFEEASDRFGSTSGGYTRIVKLGLRPGDAASMSLVELISVEKSTKGKKKTKAKKTAPARKSATAKEKAVDTKTEKKPKAKPAESKSSTKTETTEDAPKKKPVKSKTTTKKPVAKAEPNAEADK